MCIDVFVKKDGKGMHVKYKIEQQQAQTSAIPIHNNRTIEKI